MSKKMAGGTPRLWLVIFKSFWKRFAIQALVTFVEVNLISSNFCLAFAISSKLIAVYQAYDSLVTEKYM